VQDALDNAVVTEYDALGRILSVTAPGGRVTRHSYDVLGRLLQTTDPEDGLTRFGYDAKRQPHQPYRCQQSHQHQYSYDPLNRIVQVTDPAWPGYPDRL
jgi:YD repeat-containing protein